MGFDDQCEQGLVVGLTGPFGAGCTTVAEFLEGLGFSRVSLSDVVLESAVASYPEGGVMYSLLPEHVSARVQRGKAGEIHGVHLGQLPDYLRRPILQDEGNRLREQNSAFLAEQVVMKLGELRDSTNLVVERICNPAEVDHFRKTLPNFYLLSLYAPQEVRWQRKEASYKGNKTFFEHDDERDSGEGEPPHGQNIKLCVDMSDVFINNDEQAQYPADRRTLRQKVRRYVRLLQMPGEKLPFAKECFMRQAYDKSFTSSCRKRKVGAVVADEKSSGDIMSSACNEVPPGVSSCEDRGGSEDPYYCQKDHEIDLIIRMWQYCPRCGKKLSIQASDRIPFRCPNSKCALRVGRDYLPGRMLDLCIATHAEEAAIIDALRSVGSFPDGVILYTTTFPCLICARNIVRAGIKNVIYTEPYPMPQSMELFDNARVQCERYEGVAGRAFDRIYSSSGESES